MTDLGGLENRDGPQPRFEPLRHTGGPPQPRRTEAGASRDLHMHDFETHARAFAGYCPGGIMGLSVPVGTGWHLWGER
jgi:hypothetical protein